MGQGAGPDLDLEATAVAAARRPGLFKHNLAILLGVVFGEDITYGVSGIGATPDGFCQIKRRREIVKDSWAKKAVDGLMRFLLVNS